MWQRKQTLFLLCSVIAIAICLFEPIGIAYTNTGIGEGHLMMNLDFNGISNADTIPEWPLFVFATATGVLSVFGIFLYHNRKTQMAVCTWAMLADLVWYVYYILFFVLSNLDMHIRFAACLPLVSCIFLWLAKKGIKNDEDLVKSMDRIR